MNIIRYGYSTAAWLTGDITMTFLKNFLTDESGASAAEYALIIAIVGVGIGAAALALGNNVTAAIGNAANDVNDCNTATGTGVSAPWSATDECAPAGGGGGTDTGGTA
ncbi:Flp family type IVb pilin [Allopontixanthobacter confluentis]|uniref:Flp family type IVb pilin n=1 Tax=Allopontixanthobacter confluentis TaxID=1849021 RepID=UPI002FCDBA75